MAAGETKGPAEPRVSVSLTRTVTILGAKGKPSLEIIAEGDQLTVQPLPRNGGGRDPVSLADVAKAVNALQDGPRS